MATNSKITHTVNYSHAVGTASYPLSTVTSASNSTGYYQPVIPTTTYPQGFWNDAFPLNGTLGGLTSISTTFTDAITKGGFPVHNLIETEDYFIVELALSGWKKKDLKIEVSDKDLLVSGEYTHTHTFPEESYRQRGITRSKFTKTIALGPNIDQDKVEAKYEDGLLTVTIQKRIKIKTVPIKVSIK